MPDGVGALVIIARSRTTVILIIIISRRGGSTSSPRRRATMSIHGEVKVLEHLIGNGRHLPSWCNHRLHLRARRRNRSIPCSQKLTLSPPCLLVQGKTLMCNIIGVLAHLPHAGEEASGTTLRAPSVTGACCRIMLFLGTALSGGHHGRDFQATILSRESEWFHDDLFIKDVERSRNNVVDEPLNVLSIVWSHAVHNCTLQLTVDKITPINLP
jgi:hypothetical protein